MFSDPWTLTQTAHVPAHAGFWETLFALANGFVGVRATLEFESPHAAPGTYFAGLYDRALASGTELVAAPAWLPLRFRLADDEPVHWDHVRLLEFSRSLDLRRGLLTTTARVAEGDRVTAVVWTTLVHAVELHLGMSYGTITPENYDGEIGVESWVDHRFGNGLGKTVRTNHWRSVVDSTSSPVTFEGRTAGTGHALTVASRLNVAGPSERRPLRRLGAVGEVVTAPAARGTPVPFARLATFAHTADGDEPPDAARLLARAEERGTASLVAAHTAEWERRWADRDVVVEGCARSQEAMRFGLFHLWWNMHPSRGCYNIAARGLTSDYHAGHFFFNTELFKLPYWSLTDPGRARALVMHRVRTLPAARRLAAAAGRRGASYPEQAGWDGEPARPRPARSREGVPVGGRLVGGLGLLAGHRRRRLPPRPRA